MVKDPIRQYIDRYYSDYRNPLLPVYNEIIAFTPYVSTATDVGGAQTYTLTMGP